MPSSLSNTAAEKNTCAYCLFICKHRQLPGSAASLSYVSLNQYCTSSPYGSNGDTWTFLLSLTVLHGPDNVTYTSDLNNKNKWWQILVIPLPYLPLTLSHSQPQEPQLKAVLWVPLEVGQSDPSQMSHRSGCIYFLLTIYLHIPLFH